jgi:hypothetical protein
MSDRQSSEPPHAFPAAERIGGTDREPPLVPPVSPTRPRGEDAPGISAYWQPCAVQLCPGCNVPPRLAQIDDAKRESLVAEGAVRQQRRLAAVATGVDRVAPARRPVAHGVGDERDVRHVTVAHAFGAVANGSTSVNVRV